MGRFRRSTWLIVGLSVLGAGACASYAPLPLVPADTKVALEARSLTDPGLRRFMARGEPGEAPMPEPWGLRQLTLAALYYSPELGVARADWGVAKAAVLTAGGRPDPNLELGIENVGRSENPSPWILGFVFDLPIVTAGKRGHRIAEAEYRSRASYMGLNSATWRVREEVRSGLLRVWSVERRSALAERVLGLRTERLALLERSRTAGAISAVVVARERALAQDARVLLMTLARDRATARSDLAGAVGVPTAALDQVALSFGAFADQRWPDLRDEIELREVALLSRADVLGALADFRAADAALRLELARQYPDLHLGPGFTWEQGERHFVLSPSLALPLFNRNRGPIAEASARRQAVAARFTALQARVLNELDRAHGQYSASRQALEASDSLVSSRRELAAAAQEALRVGEVDRLTYIDAQIDAALAEGTLLEARVQALEALGDLEDAFQRPMMGDLMELAVPARDPTNEEEFG